MQSIAEAETASVADPFEPEIEGVFAELAAIPAAGGSLMSDHADDHDSIFGDDEGSSEIQDALHHAQEYFAEAEPSMSPVYLPVFQKRKSGKSGLAREIGTKSTRFSQMGNEDV